MKEYFARRRTVTAPDGRTWTVRRVILPRVPRLEFFHRGRRHGDSTDAGWWEGIEPFDVVEGFDGLIWVMLALAAIAAIVFIVLPLLIFILDVVVVLALAAGGIAMRILFHRPWKVVARTDADIGEAHAWAVVGTRASARVVDDLASRLLQGDSPLTLDPGPPITP